MAEAIEAKAPKEDAQAEKHSLSDNLNQLLEKAKGLAKAAQDAIARSDEAQRAAVAAVYKLYHEIAEDQKALEVILEKQGFKATKPILSKPALALVKALFQDIEASKASFLTRVINALYHNNVKPDEAEGFIAANKGLREVSKLYDAEGGQSEAAQLAFKRACKDARDKKLAEVPDLEAKGNPNAGGFVLLLGRPKKDGPLEVTGVVDEEKMIKSAVRIVAKKALKDDDNSE